VNLAACAVAVTTSLAFQQPESVAFEISCPGPGAVPLILQTKAEDPRGGVGEVRAVV
jgi:hypothetical protein